MLSPQPVSKLLTPCASAPPEPLAPAIGSLAGDFRVGELISRLGRDAPRAAPALLAAIRVGWANATHCSGRLCQRSGRGRTTLPTPWGRGRCLPPWVLVCSTRSLHTAREGGQYLSPCVLVCLSPSPARSSCRALGASHAPPPPAPLNGLFLSPTFVQTVAMEPDLDPIFGPIRRGAAAALGRLVDWHGAPVTYQATPHAHRRAGRFWRLVASSTTADRALRTASACPLAAGCAPQRAGAPRVS